MGRVGPGGIAINRHGHLISLLLVNPVRKAGSLPGRARANMRRLAPQQTWDKCAHWRLWPLRIIWKVKLVLRIKGVTRPNWKSWFWG